MSFFRSLVKDTYSFLEGYLVRDYFLFNFIFFSTVFNATFFYLSFFSASRKAKLSLTKATEKIQPASYNTLILPLKGWSNN